MPDRLVTLAPTRTIALALLTTAILLGAVVALYGWLAGLLALGAVLASRLSMTAAVRAGEGEQP